MTGRLVHRLALGGGLIALAVVFLIAWVLDVVERIELGEYRESS